MTVKIAIVGALALGLALAAFMLVVGSEGSQQAAAQIPTEVEDFIPEGGTPDDGTPATTPTTGDTPAPIETPAGASPPGSLPVTGQGTPGSSGGLNWMAVALVAVGAMALGFGAWRAWARRT